jgi:hypothetical protein
MAITPETMTRAQALRLAPATVMDAIFDRKQPSPQLGTASIACVEQLRAATVPVEGLDVAIVAWSSALDGLEPGEVVSHERRSRCATMLANAPGLAAMATWLEELGSRAVVSDDFDLAIRFLIRVRQTWLLTEALR